MVEEKRSGQTVEDWDLNSLKVGEAFYGFENRDWHHPLESCIDQIVKLTGLCPGIVKEWKGRVWRI